MKRIIKFIKDWTLPISIIIGVLVYCVYANIESLNWTHSYAAKAVDIVQPIMIFSMLFLSFCKVNPKDLKPHKWQFKLLAVQTIGFFVCALPIIIFPDMPGRIVLESGMLCLITPTATAAVVVTSKLKGNVSYVAGYTCLSNVAAAIIFSAIIPLLHEGIETGGFFTSFMMIICKVFPVLILPLVSAMIVRYCFPSLLNFFARNAGVAFYLWAFTLAICMAMTSNAIAHSHESMLTYILIGSASAICCALQFKMGHVIGLAHDEIVAGGQSLGQKNTNLAIWLAYTFMNPLTALAGGFYIVWQNSYNSYQLYKNPYDLSK